MASNVWYCIPSARPVPEAQRCVDAWRDMGYKVALWRDQPDSIQADFVHVSAEYPGYYNAANALIARVFRVDPECNFAVTGGDDLWPDQGKTAQEIAGSFTGSFCVMQPTGDGHGIETICGSPWIGRAFAAKAYEGCGPFWHEYSHMFGDEELQNVALKLGCFWQRPDLTHRHEHWSWSGKPMPEFLKEANSPEHWAKYQALYLRRKAAGFPGL